MTGARHPASPAARSDAASLETRAARAPRDRRTAAHIQIAATRALQIVRAHRADDGPARAARAAMEAALSVAPPADAGGEGSPAMWRVLRTAMNCWSEADDPDRRELWSDIVAPAAESVIKDQAGYRRARPTGRDAALPDN